jgi:arylsulfatase A-like enzyme
VVFCLSACGGHTVSPPPNLILISLDTLRADHVGCYGYPRPTTPTIDGIAHEGVVFERTIANSPWTLPSHASMLTGLQPRHHGVRTHDSALPESIPTLASELAAHGYLTMAIVNNTYLGPRYGLDRGFERFKYVPESIGEGRVRSGKQQVDLATEWVNEASGSPFFLFLHNYDIHSDYAPSPHFEKEFAHPYAGAMTGTTRDLLRVRKGEIQLSRSDLQHVVDLYDAGICEIDHELARFIGFLRQTGNLDRTILVITSDHGEEFLEHGGVLHGRTMHRELLDVPLIIRGPSVPEGQRVLDLVQTSDIFPTVIELLGFDPVPSVDGTSLVDVWAGRRVGTPGRRAYAEADHNRDLGDDTLEMVQTDGFKLVFERPTKNIRLYDCLADPRELIDVASQYPEVTGDLVDDLHRLDAGRRSGSRALPLTETEEEQLRALGYLR